MQITYDLIINYNGKPNEELKDLSSEIISGIEDSYIGKGVHKLIATNLVSSHMLGRVSTIDLLKGKISVYVEDTCTYLEVFNNSINRGKCSISFLGYTRDMKPSIQITPIFLEDINITDDEPTIVYDNRTIRNHKLIYDLK